MKIFSVHYNKPEYIIPQFNSLKKHLSKDFIYYVIDNSDDEDTSILIKNKCSEITCTYFKVEKNDFDKNTLPSFSHANALNFSLQFIEELDDIMFIDHDIFLINDFQNEYDYDIITCLQERGHIKYPWPGLCIFNKVKNFKNVNFLSTQIDGIGCDTGGNLYFYIKDNNCNVKNLNQLNLFQNLETQLLGDCFLHICKGSNWNNNNEELNKKYELIKQKYNIEF